MRGFMCGPGDKMRMARTCPIFVFFSAKTDLETEVLGREKTKTEFEIPQSSNTIYSAYIFPELARLQCHVHLE